MIPVPLLFAMTSVTLSFLVALVYVRKIIVLTGREEGLLWTYNRVLISFGMGVPKDISESQEALVFYFKIKRLLQSQFIVILACGILGVS